MPTFEVTSPDGTKYRVVAPDGATQSDAIAYVQGNLAATKSGGVPAPSESHAEQPPASGGSGLLRQIGLTARYGIEGAGDALDMLASPIRGALNAVLPDSLRSKPGGGKTLSDAIGLPTPQTRTERIVGDATKTLASAAIPLGMAGTVSRGATGVAQGVADIASSNPGMQLLSGASSGASGGYAREAGGNDADQIAASIAGGVAAPLSATGLASVGRTVGKGLASAGRDMLSSIGLPAGANPMQVDVTINNALQGSGVTFGDLAPRIRAGLRDDVKAALDAGGSISPDAIRRLADYRLTGTTPTMAGVTLDPAIVSQQRNLAKLGINSKDVAAQQLGQVENTNNRQIIANLNDLGAANAGDSISGAQHVMGALAERNQRAKEIIGQRYDAARAMDGRSAELSPAHFAQAANDLLDQSLLGGKLPSDVRNLLNNAATGKMPLTVDTAEQFKTRIGDLQRSSTDPAERKALGLVRQALDDTPLLDPSQMGQPAIDAFNRARVMNRAWMNIVDKTPALQAVRDGVEPDKFVQQFIIGQGGKANVMDVAALKNSIKGSPDAMNAVKGQIVSYLKNAAISGAADEVGNVSQSAFNKAMNAVGDRKLALFFSPEEIALLHANGRVASYEQFQPRGAAVNNSNTAGTALSALMDRIGDSAILSKIPFGRELAVPAQNISIGIKSRQAMNIPAALSLRGVELTPAPPMGLLVSPAAFMAPRDERRGLLSAP